MKIFLTICTLSIKEEGGNKNGRLCCSSKLYLPNGQPSILIDGKDKVCVVAFCCSRNNLCSTGSFRSVDTEFILISC